MVPQTVSILTNNQLQFLQHSTMTKVINSLLHLINGNAILLTKASRLRVVLEYTQMLAVKSCVIIKPTLSILEDKASIKSCAPIPNSFKEENRRQIPKHLLLC